MTIVKKTLSVVMAIALVLSALAIGASAAGTATGNEYMTITVSTNENYMPDDTVTVTLKIKNNYNCTAFRFPVMFDNDIYEVPAVTGITALGNCKTKGTFGYNLSAETAIPDAYNASDWGCILFQWTAGAANNEVTALNSEDGQDVLSFNLKVKSTALSGSAGTIFVPEEYDGFYYQAITDVTDATTFYYLDADTLTRTFVPANPTIIGEPIVLSAKAGTSAVVDETNKYVYGLASPMPNRQAFDDYLELSGTNAKLEYTLTRYGLGTGAKVKITLAGNVVSTYNVIIFGDVNGDSYVDQFDLLEYLNVINSIKGFDAVQSFAGDVTSGDGKVDAMDLIKILNKVNSIADISQANPYQ